MAPHSSTLAWKIPWVEGPGGLQSMGSLRVRHNWATSLFTSHLSIRILMYQAMKQRHIIHVLGVIFSSLCFYCRLFNTPCLWLPSEKWTRENWLSDCVTLLWRQTSLSEPTTFLLWHHIQTGKVCVGLQGSWSYDGRSVVSKEHA